MCQESKQTWESTFCTFCGLLLNKVTLRLAAVFLQKALYLHTLVPPGCMYPIESLLCLMWTTNHIHTISATKTRRGLTQITDTTLTPQSWTGSPTFSLLVSPEVKGRGYLLVSGSDWMKSVSKCCRTVWTGKKNNLRTMGVTGQPNSPITDCGSLRFCCCFWFFTWFTVLVCNC